MEDHTIAPDATEPAAKPTRVPWNKGKLLGAGPPSHRHPSSAFIYARVLEGAIRRK